MVGIISLYKTCKNSRSFLTGIMGGFFILGCSDLSTKQTIDVPKPNFEKAEIDKPADSAKEGVKTIEAEKRPLKPDTFEPLLEGDIAERAAALGDGPYKIGTPVGGFVSDYLKILFENYNTEIEFVVRGTRNPAKLKPEVCDFTEAVLFSDEINLSEFYWPHPDARDVPLRKIDSHTYQLTDDTNLLIHFEYDDIVVPSNKVEGAGLRVNNSILYLCDFGPHPYLSDGNVYEWVKDNKGRCDYEYDTDTSPVFSRSYPGSTIGFFWLESELYIISAQLFDYAIYNSRSVERSLIAISTSKVNYEPNGQMRGFAANCIYYGSLPEN